MCFSKLSYINLGAALIKLLTHYVFYSRIKSTVLQIKLIVSCNKIHIDWHSEAQKQQITSKLPRKKHKL